MVSGKKCNYVDPKISLCVAWPTLNTLIYFVQMPPYFFQLPYELIEITALSLDSTSCYGLRP